MHNRPDRSVPPMAGTGRSRRRSATSASINWAHAVSHSLVRCGPSGNRRTQRPAPGRGWWPTVGSRYVAAYSIPRRPSLGPVTSVSLTGDTDGDAFASWPPSQLRCMPDGPLLQDSAAASAGVVKGFSAEEVAAQVAVPGRCRCRPGNRPHPGPWFPMRDGGRPRPARCRVAKLWSGVGVADASRRRVGRVGLCRCAT